MTDTANSGDDRFPFHRPYAVAAVPPKGSTVTIEADAAEREGLARLMDIVAIDRLSAELTLTPFRRSGVKIVGTVRANVKQACVITLDPVDETIEEPIEIRFLPASEIEAMPDEVEIDVDAADPPEPLDGPTVDLGALAAEFVAVALDPYPRAPGASFEDVIEDAGEPEAPPSPFGKLVDLKRDEP